MAARQGKTGIHDVGNAQISVVDGNLVVADYWLQHAMDVIQDTYGETVSAFAKKKDLLKFGENAEVGTSKATLMKLPTGVLHETYVTDNLITHISSSSASDTGDVLVEYHTIDGNGDFTFGVQTITLVGQTKTALTTPCARVSHVENAGTADLVGSIYVYEDDTVVAGVPQTAAKIHLITNAGTNNSDKCATTISSTDFWVITEATAIFLEKAAGYAEVHLETRKKGSVFVEKVHLAVNDGGANAIKSFKPYLIVPHNADVRMVAEADGATTYVGGTMDGILVKVIS